MKSTMDSLIELCDLISICPSQYTDKVVWICGRCPSAQSLLSGSPRVSRSQLNAVLAISRFLSKCPNYEDQRPKSLILAFYRAVPFSFTPSFWPQSFGNDAISSFFNDYLAYMCKATELASDFSRDVAVYTGEIVTAAINNVSGDFGIARVFLNALCSNFPPILSSDANNLVSYLLDRFEILVPSSPRELFSTTSEATSCQSSPLNANHYQYRSNDTSNASESSASGTSKTADDATSASSARSVVINGSNAVWKSHVDSLGGNLGFNDGVGNEAIKGAVASFEAESVECLEKQEIAFKLITHILDKATVDSKLLEQVRLVAKEQLQSMLAFLKVNFVKLSILPVCSSFESHF